MQGMRPKRVIMDELGIENTPRCSVRSVAGAGSCPEKATYAFNTETAEPLYSCIRCVSGAVFLLTKRGSVVVTRINLRENDGPG